MKKLSFSNAFMMRGMRLKMVLFLLANLAAATMNAQIYTVKVEPQEIDQVLSLKEPIQIPSFELDGLSDAHIIQLKAEDEKNNSLGHPLRVAVPIQTRINTSEHGVWTESRGKKLWLLEIKTQNAGMIAPIFSQLNLAGDDEIWMFTNDKSLLMGPITSENIPQKLEKISADFLPSEKITIAYFTNKESELEISGLNVAYRKSLAKVGFGGSLACQIEVTNPVADAFKFEQNAVAVLLKDDDHGTALCTGTVINNTNEDFRPFILSANHCFSNLTVVPSNIRVRFRWQDGMIRSTVSGFFNRRTFSGHITYIGANIRAQSEQRADFALIEMFNRTNPSHNISFLGWNRTATPQTSTFLHHPQGDFMKIARDGQAATQSTNGTLGTNGWSLVFHNAIDFGFLETGSSGAALLNENHLICGQHSNSFPANCARIPVSSQSGRLGSSYRGDGILGTRLSDLLAPNGDVDAQTATFQLDANRFISCSNVSQTITAPNLTTASGIVYEYAWTASPNLTITGTGNQIQVSARSSMPPQTSEFVRCEIRTPRHLGSLLVGRSNQHALTWQPFVKVMHNGSVTFVNLNRSYSCDFHRKT